MVLSQGRFCPPGTIWQCLEIILIAIFGGCYYQYVLQCTGQPLQQKIIQQKVSIMLRLRNSAVTRISASFHCLSTCSSFSSPQWSHVLVQVFCPVSWHRLSSQRGSKSCLAYLVQLVETGCVPTSVPENHLSRKHTPKLSTKSDLLEGWYGFGAQP